MGTCQVIPTALDIAVQVAGAITAHAYKPQYSLPHEIVLFGSTIQNHPARDVDLLVLHSSSRLKKFGYATVYNKTIRRMVPDPDAKNLQEKIYRPEAVLEVMGAPNVADVFEAEHELRSSARGQIDELYDSGRYFGTLTLPHIGALELEPCDSEREVIDQVRQAYGTRVRSQSVFAKVASIMKTAGLDLDEVLDLHVMHRELLATGELDELRPTIIGQCADPTFWHTVLSTGRIYDPGSRTFDTPVSARYPEALALFQQ